MTAVLLALWLAHPMLAIEGDSTCPTPAQVDEELGNLAARREGGREEPSAQHRAYLSMAERFVNIELLGPDGGLLAERQLDRSASCPELAQAVAVILAAWEANFSPRLAPTVVEPPAPPPAPPAAPPPAPAAVVAQPEPAAKRPLTFDAGMGMLTSVAGGEAVFGAKLEGTIFPLAIPIGLDSVLSVASTHTQAISSPAAEARWMRPALSIGPNFRWRGKPAAMLDIHAGGVLAVLRVQGAGALFKTSSDTSLQFGLCAGLRGLWTWNNGAAWLGAELYAYPGQDRLAIGNYGDAGRLPHMEVQLAFGISLGQFR